MERDAAMDKIFSIIAVFIFAFIASAIAIATVYGPFNEIIYLGTPDPGVSAKDALKKYMVPVPNRSITEGDQVILCNGTACVTYTRTYNGWVGGPAVKQTVVNGGGGGGGGSGGGSGGGGGFGGDNCSVRPRTGTACSSVNGVSVCETFDDHYVDCGFG